jgi:hypothetical protein
MLNKKNVLIRIIALILVTVSTVTFYSENKVANYDNIGQSIKNGEAPAYGHDISIEYKFYINTALDKEGLTRYENIFQIADNNLIFRFVLVYIVICILNISGLKLFEIYGFENMYTNGVTLLLPFTIISFIVSKNFVLNNKKRIAA